MMAIATNCPDAPTAAPRRRFRLLDAMVLVAATAIGCGLMQAIARAARRSPYELYAKLVRPALWYDLMANSGKILVLTLLTMPLVAMVTLALIPIRLVGTPPQFRRVARQPGLMASCASCVAIAYLGLPVVVVALAAGAGWHGVSRMLADQQQIYFATMHGGLAVLVSWMTLFAGGRWHAERSWIDRLGRAVGLCWIVAAVAVSAAFFLVDTMQTHCGIRFPSPTLVAAVGRKILHLATVAIPPVALLTLALIPIRMIGPRPRFRRLARQPGLMATFASGAAMALIGLQFVLLLLIAIASDPDTMSWAAIAEIAEWLLSEEMVLRITRCGGFAVLVSWTTLLVGRQWRAEPVWTDRLGRVLGVCWILAAFAVAAGDALIQTDYEMRDGYLHTGGSPPTARNALP